MTDISYRDVTRSLISDIPEVRGDYEREHKKWAPDDVHAHVVYGTASSAESVGDFRLW